MTAMVQVSSRGSLTLPKSLREAFGLSHGGTVAVETRKNGILLRPSTSYPIEEYADDRIAEFDAAEVELKKRLAGRRQTK